MIFKLLTLLTLITANLSIGNDLRIESAIDAYDKGDYEQAIQQFQSLPANGHNLFNLGNAYFRNNQLGYAMAAYLGARFYLPRDPDIRANLQFAYDKIKDRVGLEPDNSPLRLVFFWVDPMTTREMLLLTLIVWALGAIWLSLCLALPVLKQQKIWGMILLAITVVLAGATSISHRFRNPWGAVIKPVAKVMSGPSANNTNIFDLKEGAPFIVISEMDQWYQIKISDGKKGWLKKSEGISFVL